MTPSSITRLGVYQIMSAVGAGGMGEVYRAKDTKLGRDVALKILPASFTNDPERVARFRREAQVLASLNQPHIAQNPRPRARLEGAPPGMSIDIRVITRLRKAATPRNLSPRSSDNSVSSRP
jgi:serine/threonine protein kinase